MQQLKTNYSFDNYTQLLTIFRLGLSLFSKIGVQLKLLPNLCPKKTKLHKSVFYC